MSDATQVARIASLIGDPARANILSVLMDGRALTAKELAFVARVSPQTTSGHLAKLTLKRCSDGTVHHLRAGTGVQGQHANGWIIHLR